MSEKKFTPGPWLAVYRGSYGEGEEGDVHEKVAWDVDRLDSGFMRGEFRWPDACLIAAAPELYEALEGIVSSLQFGTPDALIIREEIKLARAALAKARGETP